MCDLYSVCVFPDLKSTRYSCDLDMCDPDGAPVCSTVDAVYDNSQDKRLLVTPEDVTEAGQ
jgi:hypothetical protein